MSPDLPVFPCGVAGPALDAALLYATTKTNATGPDWDNDRYDPCYGDLYTAGEGATNAGITAGAGVNHKATPLNPADDEPYAFISSAPGSVTANYTYSEPCQDLNGGDPPPPEAVTGEAIGRITVSGPTLGTAASASVTNKFWWSRIGLVAIVGLDDTIVDLNGGAAPAPFTSPVTVGVAAAIFIPTVLPNCGAPTHTHPNDIIIAAAAAGVGTNIPV